MERNRARERGTNLREACTSTFMTVVLERKGEKWKQWGSGREDKRLKDITRVNNISPCNLILFRAQLVTYYPPPPPPPSTQFISIISHQRMLDTISYRVYMYAPPPGPVPSLRGDLPVASTSMVHVLTRILMSASLHPAILGVVYLHLSL